MLVIIQAICLCIFISSIIIIFRVCVLSRLNASVISEAEYGVKHQFVQNHLNYSIRNLYLLADSQNHRFAVASERDWS